MNMTSTEENNPAYWNQNKGPRIAKTSIALIVLSTTAVFLRLVAQRLVQRAFAADDYLILFTWVRTDSKTKPDS